MKIDTLHPIYQKMERLWRLCRDAAEGEPAVKAAKETYLPRLTGERDDDYNARLKMGDFVDYTDRTLQGLVGQVFAKPPVKDNAKEDDLEEVTAGGDDIEAFASEALNEVLMTGRFGILVDMPQGGGNAYLAAYLAEDIISWEASRIQGKDKPIRIVLRERAYQLQTSGDRAGAYELTDRFRLLALDKEGDYFQQVFTKTKTEKGDEWKPTEAVYPEIQGKRMMEIPFVFCGPKGGEVTPQKPPIYGVASLNISHYRSSVNQEAALGWAAGLSFFVFGASNEEAQKIVIGQPYANSINNPQGRAEILEAKGSSLDALDQALAKKEMRMALLGLRMLEPQKKASESASNQAMQKQGESSFLASVAKAVSRQINLALWFRAQMNGNPQSPTIQLNTEYSPFDADPALIQALSAQVAAGQVSRRTLHYNLKRMGLMPLDWNLDDEESAITAEMITQGPTMNPIAQPDPTKEKKN